MTLQFIVPSALLTSPRLRSACGERSDRIARADELAGVPLASGHPVAENLWLVKG